MSHLQSRFAVHFPKMRVANTASETTASWSSSWVSIRRFIGALCAVRGADTVYIAVKAGNGMWLTAAIAGLARILGAEVFLHHHSYAYVRTRKARMVALVRAAGPSAHHIVLSRTMARDLVDVMPEIGEPMIIGNASLVDRNLVDLPLKKDGDEMVLGHLSNLSAEKGIGEVVKLAIALHEAQVRFRLLVAGPTSDAAARLHLNIAARELGDKFEYRGPVLATAKHAFFGEITHFVFPTRYVHEAVPLVLYEALAAGVVCVTTRMGSISEQLEDCSAVLASEATTFVEETLLTLANSSVSAVASAECRRAFLSALAQSEDELTDVLAVLGSG